MELEDLRRVVEEQLKLSRKLKARLQELEGARHAPLAVVGMALRFPGGLNTPDEYWRFLRTDGSVISEIPEDRKGLRAVYDPRPNQLGRSYVNRAGFLKDIASFDASFFGISQREAEALDPQQRLLLETSWEAFERAGIAVRRHERLAAGVFVGIMASEYGERIPRADKRDIDPYYGTGGGHCFAAGRISYALGFSGSAISVDTACSSSLVALHLGAQSLRNNDCKYALVAGSNLILSGDLMISLCQSKALAPDGRSKTFTADADGYGRGEGIGVVVLMRLADAEREQRPILAVLRGTATNHDGASSGLTVPSGPAQQQVIRSALEDAGIEACEVGYVEAHGTGTALGDPIEVSALDAVLGNGAGERSAPLHLGSVKSRIGHLEAAAGIAGVIKVVLMLEHGEVPAALSASDGELNTLIPWRDFNVLVPRRLLSWPKQLERRIAGTSAFGLSGTNAHAVLEAYKSLASEEPSSPALELFTLSAKDPTSLRELTKATIAYFNKLPAARFASACRTAREGRCAHRHRLSLVAANKQELVAKLSGLLSEQTELPAGTATVLSGHLRIGGDSAAVQRGTHRLAECFPVFAGLREKKPDDISALEGLLSELGFRCKTIVDSSWVGGAVQLEWGNRKVTLIDHDADSAPRLFLETLSALYQSGVDVRFGVLGRQTVRFAPDMPTHPFQRKRYWIDEPMPGGERSPAALVSIDGKAEPSAAGRSGAEVEAFLMDELREVLRAEGELDCTQSFLAVGGDSFMAMLLKRSVEQTYEVEIPLEDLSTDLPLSELLRRLSGHVLKISSGNPLLEEKSA